MPPAMTMPHAFMQPGFHQNMPMQMMPGGYPMAMHGSMPAGMPSGYGQAGMPAGMPMPMQTALPAPVPPEVPKHRREAGEEEEDEDTFLFPFFRRPLKVGHRKPSFHRELPT
jgi:hypothetical protein